MKIRKPRTGARSASQQAKRMCFQCGAVMRLQTTPMPYTVPDGRTVTVDVEMFVCANCDAEIFTADQADAAEKAVYQKLAEMEGSTNGEK